MYKQPKPILRYNTHTDLYSAFNDAINKFITNPLAHPFQNCLNCKHWNFGKDQCSKFNTRPPTEIIVYSCPAFEDGEDIPF